LLILAFTDFILGVIHDSDANSLGILNLTKIGYFNTGIGQEQSLVLYSISALILLIFALCAPSYASSGTEGASFLDIPVGAGPAAMGAAYSALADDAYAATLNPSGLGFLGSTQFAAQHLSYLESIDYEYLSFGVPLSRRETCTGVGTCPGSGIGGSVQYLGSGDITGTDQNGNPTGNFSSYYSASNLSYGRSLTDRFSAGITGKWINAKIGDASANAFAADLGSMYIATDKLTFAGVLSNMGSNLRFLNQGDPLPLAFHVGAAYRPAPPWLISVEGVFPETGLASAHVGLEWHPIPMIALRTGYRTDTVTQLGALAGFSTGIGIKAFGQEFSYAWVPMGDLGNTNYLSLIIRFGTPPEEKRNLIQYQTIKSHKMVEGGDATQPDYQQLMNLLNQDEPVLAQPATTNKSGDN